MDGRGGELLEQVRQSAALGVADGVLHAREEPVAIAEDTDADALSGARLDAPEAADCRVFVGFQVDDFQVALFFIFFCLFRFSCHCLPCRVRGYKVSCKV